MAVSENPFIDLQTLALLWHIHSLYSQFIMIPPNEIFINKLIDSGFHFLSRLLINCSNETSDIQYNN